MEEFIPESIAFDHKAEKASTLIGLQEKPHDDVIGGSGEPLADLLARFNNEMGKDRIVFVLEDTLFCSGNRLLRVNEELVFRPQHHTKIDARDIEGLESDWKVHPVVEEQSETDEEVPPADFIEDDDDLEDLPFDTGVRTQLVFSGLIYGSCRLIYTFLYFHG